MEREFMKILRMFCLSALILLPISHPLLGCQHTVAESEEKNVLTGTLNPIWNRTWGGNGITHENNGNAPQPAQPTFTTTTVDSTGNVGGYTSIAVDSAGYVHISYYDYVTGAKVTFKNSTKTVRVMITNPDGMVTFHAPKVDIDSAYTLSANKTGYLDANVKIIIVKKGMETNRILNDEGDFWLGIFVVTVMLIIFICAIIRRLLLVREMKQSRLSGQRYKQMPQQQPQQPMQYRR